MSAHGLSILLLALAGVLGCLRVWRAGTAHRSWLCALQLALAAALYFCLWPRSGSEQFTQGELVVLAPGASAQQIAAARGTLVALPGVEAPRAIERVPDLAAALREHADAQRLRVIGGGLPARDLDAARGRLVAFDAAPLPPGIVELDVPPRIAAGTQWQLQGRAEGLAAGRVELRDPAGQVSAAVEPDAQGRFTLGATAKDAGAAVYELRALDAKGALVERLDLPIVAEAGSALRILLLAGAPDAQLKYLRRWAQDAGLVLASRIGLSTGVVMREGTPQIDAATLAATDLVVIDERAWWTLDASHKQALRSAVDAGLGLLLRVTGELPDAVARDWRALGFSLEAQPAAGPVSLDQAAGLHDSRLEFTPLPLTLAGADTAPLLRADDGTVLAVWRGEGRGRVGVMRVVDDWRLALAGHRLAHASLWSRIVARLARARAAADPQLPRSARVGERAVICAAQAGDVIAPEPAGMAPIALDVSTSDGCAGWWPAQAGWHALLRGSRRWPVHVQAADAAPALAQAQRTRATRALLGVAPDANALATRAQPWPRWPFLFLVIGLASLLWWLERRLREA